MNISRTVTGLFLGGVGVVVVLGVFLPSGPIMSEKGRVKRTAADLRHMAGALRGFHESGALYPRASTGPDAADFPEPYLTPRYLKSLPQVDGWGHRIRYWSNGDHFALASYGSDAVPDRQYDELAAHAVNNAWCVCAPGVNCDDMVIIDEVLCELKVQGENGEPSS